MMWFLVAMVIATGLPDIVVAEPVPPANPQTGHADFRPSAVNPIGWRGDGFGCYPGATPVVGWDEKSSSNILWKIAMPYGYGAPIVVGGATGGTGALVFVQADPHVLFAVDALTGKIVWQSSDETVAAEDEKDTYRGWYGWYGASFPTPVSDGRFVYSKYGDMVECHDLGGKLQWTRTVDKLGNGTSSFITQSPMLADGRLIFLAKTKAGQNALVALDAGTGAEVWRTVVTPEAGAETVGAAMPVVVRLDGVQIVVTHMGAAVRAKDGRLLGTNLFFQGEYKPLPYDIVTPVNRSGEALLRGYRAGALRGLTFEELHVSLVRLRFQGEAKDRLVAESVWGPRRVEAVDGGGPKYAQQIQHVLYHDGHWYLQGWPDLLTLDTKSGRTVTWKKAPREMGGHTVWHEYPTTHLAGKYIFTGDRNGTVAVYEANPEWRMVGLSRVDSPWHSNPCFHGGRMYVRTLHALCCIGKTGDR